MTINSNAYTWYFSDIFSDESDFTQTLETMMTFSGHEMFQGLSQKLYNYLSRKYHNVNVRYSDKNDFITSLAEVLDNALPKLKLKNYLVQGYQQFTPLDLQVISNTLSSYTDAPNSQHSPKAIADYVTNQNYTQNEQNLVVAWLQMLDNIPTLDIQTILDENGINNLFMQVIPNVDTIYY